MDRINTHRHCVNIHCPGVRVVGAVPALMSGQVVLVCTGISEGDQLPHGGALAPLPLAEGPPRQHAPVMAQLVHKVPHARAVTGRLHPVLDRGGGQFPINGELGHRPDIIHPPVQLKSAKLIQLHKGRPPVGGVHGVVQGPCQHGHDRPSGRPHGLQQSHHRCHHPHLHHLPLH